MMRRSHQYAALLTAVTIAPEVLSPTGALLAIPAAVITSYGALSPDVDLRLRGVRHRGPTHTIEYVLVAAIAVYASLTLLGLAPIGLGVALGWMSHIMSDFLFGTVPSVLLRRRVGLHVRTGGRVEAMARPVLIIGIGAIIIARVACSGVLV